MNDVYSAHPYYDPRSNEFKPTWYMVSEGRRNLPQNRSSQPPSPDIHFLPLGLTPSPFTQVDITYQSRLEHPVTLAALKHLASLSSLEELPESCAYVEKEGLEEIKKMALVNRGRLSECD